MKTRTNPVKILLIILGIILVIAAVVLSVLIYSGDLRLASLQENVENSYLFGRCSGDVNHVELDETLISVKGMESYKGATERISSGYFLKKLREGQEDAAVSLYNAIVYAIDNDFNFISLPCAVYEQETVEKAVWYAFCDLPTVDRSTQAGFADSSITLSDGTVSKRFYLYFPTGSTEHLSYKKKAVEAAKQLVAELPSSCDTDMKKAAYFYDWLVRNVQYTADENYDSGNPYYLYDTLVGRVSNAVGFSNTYTLLLNLCGVEGFSVYRPEGRERRSDTWNVFRADGFYYQADLMADAGIYSLGLGNLNLGFCLSKEALGYEYDAMIQQAAPASDATNHDRDHIDAVAPGIETAHKDLPEILSAREALENGAPYVAVRCNAFENYSWSDNFRVISRWFADCSVDFNMANCGDRICVIYPKK